MEPVKELINVLNALNDSIKKLTEKMSTECISTLTTTQAEEPIQEEKPTEIQAEKAVQEEKPVDRLEVRAKLAELSCLGFSDEVRKLLQKHGAERLSAVEDAELPALLKEAEAIGT